LAASRQLQATAQHGSHVLLVLGALVCQHLAIGAVSTVVAASKATAFAAKPT